MEKLLTISVAAYNVEKFLRDGLEEIAACKNRDLLEVFIVDDGGPDHSLEIAKEFADKYPGVFYPIHKENGGYGTTVNYSVEHATGKYFRLLDGDDYLSTDGLDQLTDFLKENTVDMIITKYKRVGEDGGEVYNFPKDWGQYGNKIYKIKELKTDYAIGMWETSFRTELVKKHHRELPKHTLYTDQLFVGYPLPYVETVAIQPYYLYHYRVGRDEQSISVKSRSKHYQEQLTDTKLLLDYYNEFSDKDFSPLCMTRFYSTYLNSFKTLLVRDASRKNRKELKNYDKEIKNNYPLIWQEGTRSRLVRLMRKTNFLAYWPVKLFCDQSKIV